MTKLILMIDDEERLSRVIELTLKITAGWEVIIANSGRDGLQKAEAQQPDLILLDWMMPDLDGMSTLAKLKENAATNAIPVILLTAKVQLLEQINLSEEGIVAVFIKPFNPITLADEIAKACNW